MLKKEEVSMSFRCSLVLGSRQKTSMTVKLKVLTSLYNEKRNVSDNLSKINGRNRMRALLMFGLIIFFCKCLVCFDLAACSLIAMSANRCR